MSYQEQDDKTLNKFDLKRMFLSCVKIEVKREEEESKRNEKSMKN